MGKKRKAECTPEQWERHLAQKRRWNNKPDVLERRRAADRRYSARRAAKRAVDNIARSEGPWLDAEPAAAAAAEAKALGDALFDLVVSAAKSVRREDREDAVSELVVACLEGRVPIDGIAGAAKRYASHSLRRSLHGLMSLDESVPGAGGATFANLLESETEHV